MYILTCSDNTYYTGITNDLNKRIKTHNSGKGAKYTKNRLPVTLLEYKVVNNKSEALKLEYKVKKQPRGKKVTFLRSS